MTTPLGPQCAIAIRPSAISFQKRSGPEAARNGLAALGKPLGRAMSVIGGKSEVSALREFFAV
jgi:hypothetical protein